MRSRGTTDPRRGAWPLAAHRLAEALDAGGRQKIDLTAELTTAGEIVLELRRFEVAGRDRRTGRNCCFVRDEAIVFGRPGRVAEFAYVLRASAGAVPVAPGDFGLVVANMG